MGIKAQKLSPRLSRPSHSAGWFLLGRAWDDGCKQPSGNHLPRVLVSSSVQPFGRDIDVSIAPGEYAVVNLEVGKRAAIGQGSECLEADKIGRVEKPRLLPNRALRAVCVGEERTSVLLMA